MQTLQLYGHMVHALSLHLYTYFPTRHYLKRLGRHDQA